RALWVLRNVDRILCEDTRVTARLLGRYRIDKPLSPYHDHNADRVRPAVLAGPQRGGKLAAVAEAGQPVGSRARLKLRRRGGRPGIAGDRRARSVRGTCGTGIVGTATRPVSVCRLPAPAGSGPAPGA